MFTDDQLKELESLLQQNGHHRNIRIELNHIDNVTAHQCNKLVTLFTHVTFHHITLPDDTNIPPTTLTHQQSSIGNDNLHNYETVNHSSTLT